jgi:hypothetical protein
MSGMSNATYVEMKGITALGRLHGRNLDLLVG